MSTTIEQNYTCTKCSSAFKVDLVLFGVTSKEIVGEIPLINNRKCNTCIEENNGLESKN
jgi:hypothetical protein